MKNLIVGIAACSIFIVAINSAEAQTKTPTPNLKHISHAHVSLNNSPQYNLHVKFRKELAQIQKDVKSGKISKVQAQSLHEKIKNIRIKEIGLLKNNGSKELTSDQISELNTELDQVATSL